MKTYSLILMLSIIVASFFSAWGFPYNLPLCILGGLAGGGFYAASRY